MFFSGGGGPEVDEAYLCTEKVPTRQRMGTSEPVGSPCGGTSSSSFQAVTVGETEDKQPQKLSCYYKHHEIQHTGWMTSIRLQSGKAETSCCVHWVFRKATDGWCGF